MKAGCGTSFPDTWLTLQNRFINDKADIICILIARFIEKLFNIAVLIFTRYVSAERKLVI